MEKGASNWLTVLIEEFGFTLHKGAFRDALALRYGWVFSVTGMAKLLLDSIAN